MIGYVLVNKRGRLLSWTHYMHQNIYKYRFVTDIYSVEIFETYHDAMHRSTKVDNDKIRNQLFIKKVKTTIEFV